MQKNRTKLWPKFIYISNLSSFLQLLALNKAYYLKIRVGLIIESRQNLLNFAAILELLRNFQISVAIPSEVDPKTIRIDKFRLSLK